MAHSLSNSKSRSAAKAKLLYAFEHSEILSEIPSIWNSEYDGFRNEIKKCNLDWLQPNDVDVIVATAFLRYPGLNRESGRMVDIIAPEIRDKVADSVLDWLAAPNEYWFRFPLPQITLEHNVQLTEEIIIERDDREAQKLGKSVSTGSSLKVLGRGFVLGMRSQSAFIDAMTKVKWTLQLATLNGLLKWAPKRKGGLTLAIGGASASEVFEVPWTTKAPLPVKTFQVPLGVGLSKYLSELEFENGNAVRKFKFGHLGRELNMLRDPVSQKNVSSIRRSLEWAFDSNIDEDEHMRFIKTCIGLEAAIAEQNEDVGITEQLADRCAFLLEKTAVAREETRDLLRRIYKLRSKLVHGAANGLSGADVQLAK